MLFRDPSAYRVRDLNPCYRRERPIRISFFGRNKPISPGRAPEFYQTSLSGSPECGRLHSLCLYASQVEGPRLILSDMKIRSYIEVGVGRGGTFIVTVEYLNRFHPIERAVAVVTVTLSYRPEGYRTSISISVPAVAGLVVPETMTLPLLKRQPTPPVAAQDIERRIVSKGNPFGTRYSST